MNSVEVYVRWPSRVTRLRQSSPTPEVVAGPRGTLVPLLSIPHASTGLVVVVNPPFWSFGIRRRRGRNDVTDIQRYLSGIAKETLPIGVVHTIGHIISSCMKLCLLCHGALRSSASTLMCAALPLSLFSLERLALPIIVSLRRVDTVP